MNQKRLPEITSFWLHILATVFMLCEHIAATVAPQAVWLSAIGQLALPIFAFLLVEGFFHTKNLMLYFLRLFLFALISEIPFNLAMGGNIRFPLHQNFLWSLLTGLGLIFWNERAKSQGIAKQIVVGICAIISAFIIGILTFVDHYLFGLLFVLVFYFFRGRKWWCLAGQVLCISFVSIFWASHLYPYAWTGIFSLLFIWLYRGKQGYHSKVFQYACYSFYPLHLLILGLLKIFP